MTLRLDKDLQEKLRLYRTFGGKSANDLINELVREFFECQGNAEIAEAMTEQVKKNYGVALDELRER